MAALTRMPDAAVRCGRSDAAARRCSCECILLTGNIRPLLSAAAANCQTNINLTPPPHNTKFYIIYLLTATVAAAAAGWLAVVTCSCFEAEYFLIRLTET